MGSDPEIIQFLDDVVTKNCTGKTNYEAGWWAMGFNNFSYSFTNRGFEV